VKRLPLGGNSLKVKQMDKLFLIFLITTPIAMFFSGFLMARQLRPINAALVSKLFVQKRLLLCIITGIFISIFFTLLDSAISGFTLNKIIVFIVLFVLALGSEYFGMKLGWGSSSSKDTMNESITTSSNQITADSNLPKNISIETSLSSVMITILSKKSWTLFVMEALKWIILGLCALPIFSLVIFAALQNYLPKYLYLLVWLLVGGLVVYILYIKIMETLEYIFDKEIIEIDNLSVRIEKYVSKFSSKKEYPAENIVKITGMFSFAGTSEGIKHSPFLNSNMPVFIMWHKRGLKRYRSFGRAVDLADAQKILEMIYAKFPQYKG
jgi:hypothetical protein